MHLLDRIYVYALSIILFHFGKLASQTDGANRFLNWDGEWKLLAIS